MAGLFENLDNICRYVSEKTDDLAQKISEEMAVQKIQSQIREEDRGICGTQCSLLPLLR